MPHRITTVTLENYRLFGDRQQVKFGNLNLFIGPNNSGKSSIFKMMAFLKSQMKSDSLIPNESDYTDFVNTGITDYDSIVRPDGSSPLIEFDYVIEKKNEQSINAKFTFEFWHHTNPKKLYFKVQVSNGQKPLFILWPCLEWTTPGEVILQPDLNFLKEFLKNRGMELSDIFPKAKDFGLEDNDLIEREIESFLNPKYIGDEQEQGLTKNFERSSLDSIYINGMSSERGDGDVYNCLKEVFEIIGRKVLGKLRPDGVEGLKLFFEPDSEIVYSLSKEFEDYFETYLSFVEAFKKITYLSIDRANRLRDLVPGNANWTSRNIHEIPQKVDPLTEENYKYRKPSDWEEFVLRWMGDSGFGIGDGYSIESFDSSHNEKFFKVKISRNGFQTDLANLGYGFQQLMPIIWQIGILVKKYKNAAQGEMEEDALPILCIEEPESNLHPKLQSKLAEFFVDACELFNIQFCIETHSEYLVRKLQVLIAQKYMSPEMMARKSEYDEIFRKIEEQKLGPVPDDLNNLAQSVYFDYRKLFFYYFPGDGSVREIHINENGFLSEDFGEGFWDESNRLLHDFYNPPKN